ncbi:bacteriocin, lactococcin A1 family protein, partial [Bacillus subtilis]
MKELSNLELEKVEGGNWQNVTKNTLFAAADGAAIGGMFGGPAGAFVGAHYGAAAYAIGYALDH